LLIRLKAAYKAAFFFMDRRLFSVDSKRLSPRTYSCCASFRF